MIDSFTNPLIQISSKHCRSQAGRARQLKFWDNFYPALCVMCHVSRVTCHMSPVTCHLFERKKYIFQKQIQQSGGASRWKVCYWRGLPRLVCILTETDLSKNDTGLQKHVKHDKWISPEKSLVVGDYTTVSANSALSEKDKPG